MMVPSFILGGIMPGKLLSLAVAVVTSVASASAMAADEEFYVGLGAGLAYVNDAFVKAHPSAEYSPPLDATSKVERGFAVSGTVGYGFANGVRVEGELGYRKNDLEKMTVREPGSLVVLLPPGAPPALLKGERAIDGDVSAVTLMANLYYDIDLDGGWKPYIGGGVGLAHLSLSAKSKSTGAALADDEDDVLAYQIGGGIGYEIDSSGDRSVIASLDYRYFGTEDPTFTGSLTGAKFDTEQSGHYIGVGLRFGF